MEFVQLSFFGAEPVTTALAWVLTYGLHSTALLGGTWLVLHLFSRISDRARDGMWKLALVGGVVTATAQVGLGVKPFGGHLLLVSPPPTPIEELPRVEETPPAPNLGQPRNTRLERLSTPSKVSSPIAPSVDCAPELPLPTGLFPAHLVMSDAKAAVPSNAEKRVAKRPELIARSVELEPAGKPATSRIEWTTAPAWLLSSWIGGTVLGGLALVMALIRLRRALLRRQPLESGPVAEIFASLLRLSGTKRRVRLSTSAELSVPITFGIWRPEICLPVRALVDLDREQQEAMLAHELAHSVRRDPLWQLVSKAFVAAFFFQPLNRVARKRMLDLAEFLSDDWAVAHTGRELPLASCLTEVAHWIVAGKRPLPAPGMAGGSRLGSRVHRLLDRNRKRIAPSANRTSGSVLAIASLTAFAGFVPGIAAAPQDAAAVDQPPAGDQVTEESVDVAGNRTALRVPQNKVSDSVSEPLLLKMQDALTALDLEIAELLTETATLKSAIGELPGAGELEQLAGLIEARIENLRGQRKALSDELPRLAGLLERERSRNENTNAKLNPRKASR